MFPPHTLLQFLMTTHRLSNYSPRVKLHFCLSALTRFYVLLFLFILEVCLHGFLFVHIIWNLLFLRCVGLDLLPNLRSSYIWLFCFVSSPTLSLSPGIEMLDTLRSLLLLLGQRIAEILLPFTDTVPPRGFEGISNL